jgi:hypothetical protein
MIFAIIVVGLAISLAIVVSTLASIVTVGLR